HGAVRDGAIVSPHRIEQLLAAEDDARTAHQEFQKTKFGSGERKLLARKVHSAAGAIEFELAALQEFRNRLLAAEMNLDSRDQFAHEERLDDVIVCAQFQADNAIRLRGAGR